MKKLFFSSFIGVSIISWFFFLALLFINYFPSTFVKIIDNHFLTSLSVEFSNIENSGNLLNPSFHFYDFRVTQNKDLIIDSNEFKVGITLQPQTIFSPLSVHSLSIKDAYFDSSILSSPDTSQVPLINLSQAFSVSFQNLVVKNNNFSIEINGSIQGELFKSFSGQLSFLHGDNLSSIAVNAFENSYRFSLNLHSFQWFSLLPQFSPSFLQKLSFKLNALGQFKKNKSFIEGSFDSSKLLTNSMHVKANKGSFQFQSVQDFGTLKLSEFLNPLIDEEGPIQIDMKERSILVPNLFISPQILELSNPQLSNLVIEKLFINFQDRYSYSGLIKDLDLKDVYFKEISNISGSFSGHGSETQFSLNSKNSFLRNKDNILIPISILGSGDYSFSNISLDAQIDNESSNINLALKFNPELDKPFSIELKSKNVSKKLIQFSLPQSYERVINFIDDKISFERKNSIYFNYLSNGNFSSSILTSKILINQSTVKIDTDSKINFLNPMIEFDNHSLYVFSPSGKINNFSYEEAHGFLDYKTNHLKFHSSHKLNPKSFSQPLVFSEKEFEFPSSKAINKGHIDISNQKFSNAISLQTNKVSLPITDSLDIQLNKANIYIVNLDLIHGLLPATFLNDETFIILNGFNLMEKYNLNFSSNINLELGKYIPNSSYFNIEGKELFYADLKIAKNLMPILDIFSDFKNTAFDSSLSQLIKNKSVSLPTKIVIENFADPSIKISNKMMDIHLRNLSNYDGYISIGKKLPLNFNYFREKSGMNLFIYSELITSKELNSFSMSKNESAQIDLNKLAFNFKTIKYFENTFSNVSGIFDFNNIETSGRLVGDDLNATFKMDKSGFMRLEFNNTDIPNADFISSSESTMNTNINSRLIMRDSSLGKLKIKELDVYLINNKNNFTANRIKLKSNLISISPLNEESIAFFSIDRSKPLYKIRGNYLIKDSDKIPYLKDLTDFSYFNGSLNLQWKELSTLSNIEGEVDFILKDLLVKETISNSRAFNLLGILNLRNILGKIANLDLTIDEFTSTRLSRVQGDFLFNKSKMRLASPLYVETNSAKMKWVGQINKNYKDRLNELDLNLDLRVLVGENIPWYAAILGGLPAIAGSAVINEIFEEDIDELTNYQYEILGTISKPKLIRIKSERL